MKTILHPDYWAEIPEGDYPIGLTEEQLLYIWRKMRDESGYASRSLGEQAQMDAAIEKIRSGKNLTGDEHKLFPDHYLSPYEKRRSRIVHLKRFYMARFPIIRSQHILFHNGRSAKDLPGALEEPEKTGQEVYGRCPQSILIEEALRFCEQLGGRIPRAEEWEAAARGRDGRLYPWGNEWDETRGFFYYGQDRPKACSDGKPPIDAYPNGISPFGVWGMAGGLPELVTIPPYKGGQTYEVNGEQVAISKRGRHPRESKPETAWENHIVALGSLGDWVTLRPVLDELP